jgi:hypothetical protein
MMMHIILMPSIILEIVMFSIMLMIVPMIMMPTSLMRGIIIGIIKLVSDISANRELKDQQLEALEVNQELGKLSVVKAPGEGVQANSAGAKKFTETVLNMRSANTNAHGH